jgi:hypothetical protein
MRLHVMLITLPVIRMIYSGINNMLVIDVESATDRIQIRGVLHVYNRIHVPMKRKDGTFDLANKIQVITRLKDKCRNSSIPLLHDVNPK